MLNIPTNLDPMTALVVILVSLASLVTVILNRRRLPKWLHVTVATLASIVLSVSAILLAIKILDPGPPELGELHVPAGGTLTISSDHLNMRVDHWMMEDGSTITIPSNVCGEEDCTWVIRAKTAVFGSNVRILGVGQKGLSGDSPGSTGAHATKSGGNGGHGGAGSKGLPGKSGVNIDITMGLASIGDLLIDVGGGDGGNGADGGAGGSGGQGGCSCNCDGGRGGNGGPGGPAGPGGDAGNIRLSYWMVSSEPVITGPGLGFRTNVQGGRPGKPGNGGARGSGGGGSGNCGPWPYWTHGGGSNGGKGATGAESIPGNDGSATIAVEPRPLI